MSTYRTELERIEGRVEMPEPAFDRMLRRGERRSRNRRAASAGVALVIGALGVRLAFETLRVHGTVKPASGAVPGAPGPSGWLESALPGMVLVAAALLIVTLVGVMRPVAHMRGIGAKGGADMDSETKGKIGYPAIEIPEHRADGKPPAKANRWLVVAVAVLTLAVLGLGAALIVASNDETTTPVAGPSVDPAVTTALDGMAAALSSGDVQATTAFYADNGTLILASGDTFEGTAEIEGWMTTAVGMGVQMERVSDVFGNGTFGAALYRYTATAGGGYMVRAITLDAAGKIVVEEETERWPEL